MFLFAFSFMNSKMLWPDWISYRKTKDRFQKKSRKTYQYFSEEKKNKKEEYSWEP